MLADNASTIDATLVVVAASVSAGSGTVNITLSGAASISSNTPHQCGPRGHLQLGGGRHGGGVTIDANAQRDDQRQHRRGRRSPSPPAGSVALAGAVGVASATNSIGGSTQALIADGSDVTRLGAGGDRRRRQRLDRLERRRRGGLRLDRHRRGSPGALSVSVTLAENTITGSSRAAIDGSTVVTTGALNDVSLDVTARTRSPRSPSRRRSACRPAAAVCRSRAPGPGRRPRTSLSDSVAAEIVDSDVTATGAVSVTADDTSMIDATIVSAAAAVSISGSAALSGLVGDHHRREHAVGQPRRTDRQLHGGRPGRWGQGRGHLRQHDRRARRGRGHLGLGVRLVRPLGGRRPAPRRATPSPTR